MLDLREQTFGGTFLFAPRYLDRDGLSLHYVDEGAGAPVLFVGRRFLRLLPLSNRRRAERD
jgi:hypothetical protein